MDSPYYSELEFCGGVVMVSFSKYLHWQVMHFLQRSTHFSKTCCRPLITLKFLALELHFHGWKTPEIAWGRYELNSMSGLGKVDQWNPIRTSAIQCFSKHEKEKKDTEMFTSCGWYGNLHHELIS
jgi:hypothetical protein